MTAIQDGKIVLGVAFKAPRLPNYLVRADGSDGGFDVADISDDTLREIGQDWTRRLIQHAHKRRRGSVGKEEAQ